MGGFLSAFVLNALHNSLLPFTEHYGMRSKKSHAECNGVPELDQNLLAVTKAAGPSLTHVPIAECWRAVGVAVVHVATGTARCASPLFD